MYIGRAIASLLFALGLVLFVFSLAMRVENGLSNMTGDSIAAWLFLLAGVVSPLAIIYLYVSLLHESRPRIKDLKCAVLGALLAAIVTALIGAVAEGSKGGDVVESALYGALILSAFFGIPAAVVGAVIGAIVSIVFRRGSRRS